MKINKGGEYVETAIIENIEKLYRSHIFTAILCFILIFIVTLVAERQHFKCINKYKNY